MSDDTVDCGKPVDTVDSNDNEEKSLLLNEQEKQEEPEKSRIWLLRRPASLLSPVSEIVLSFGESSITTPKTRKQKENKDGEF